MCCFTYNCCNIFKDEDNENGDEDIDGKITTEKKQVISNDNVLDTSNVDNEDSLNLTIGEEDEQLLRDEVSMVIENMLLNIILINSFYFCRKMKQKITKVSLGYLQ